jgi:hypothetical protein
MDMSDSRPDDRPDSQHDSEDARWMTFAELAEARGISRLSAATLVRRHGWRRQRDNRGHVIALVPLTWASSEPDDQADNRHDKQPDNPPDSQGYIAAFETALAAVREAKDSEIATLRQQIERLTGQADADRARADELRDRLGSLTAKLADAQAELAAAQDQAKAAEDLRRALEAAKADIEQVEQGREAAEAQADELRTRLDELLAVQQEAIHRADAAAGEALHFREGFLGGLARCIVRLRAAGDPFDQTLLLPPLILLVFVWLTETGKVGLWVTYPVLLLPPSIAGLWLGAVLGPEGLIRIMLRGMFAGAIGGGAYVAVMFLASTNETLDKQHALRDVVSMVVVNFLCFFFWGLMSATIADFASTSEAKWQALKPRRDYFAKVLRISLFMEKLEGQKLAVALGVLFCRGVLPILVTMWVSYVFFRVSPSEFIHGWVTKDMRAPAIP